MAKLLGRSKSLKLRERAESDQSPRIEDKMPERPKIPSQGAAHPNSSFISVMTGTSSSSNNVSRPKTAGEATPAKRNWSELTATGSPIIITTEEDTFRFPTPVRKAPSVSSGVKSFDMGSNDDLLGNGIGVAIGSPSQTSYFSPLGSTLLGSAKQDVITPATTPVRANTTREVKNGDMDGARPKLSRWKSLGGLFGRKRPTFPQQSRLGSQDALELKKKEVAKLRAHDIGVVTTISSAGDLKQSSRTLRKSKKSVKGRSPPQNYNAWDYGFRPGASPFLNIDIPEVRMERYSVMFSDVLPNQPTRASSLLTRRQATGDRLKPPGSSLKTLEIPSASGKLVRRATCPSPSASPSYRLFPSKQTEAEAKHELHHSNSTINRPRPLRRSRTSPSSLPTPNPIGNALSPAFEADEMDSDENGHGLTPTPSTPGSPSTPKSPSHSDAYPAVRISETSLGKSKDPEWEMITIGKPLEPGDILDDALLHEDDIDDEEWLAKTKPQVAIARSVSVTRANKQKVSVQPIRVGSISTKGRETRTAPGSRAAIEGKRNELKREILGDRGITGKDEKLKEKKAMTPTLHFVDEGMNRKSVWGQIESV